MKLEDVEKMAMKLPDSDRAVLAGHLLYSLPPPASHHDVSDAEVERRWEEMKENPSSGVSWEEIKRGLER
jgi:putative addiction module component (TIGR02574 family)